MLDIVLHRTHSYVYVHAASAPTHTCWPSLHARECLLYKQIENKVQNEASRQFFLVKKSVCGYHLKIQTNTHL